MASGRGVPISICRISLLLLLAAAALSAPGALAAVHSAASNTIAVDNTLPIILIDPVDTEPLYRPDDVIPFHWETFDENFTTFPQNFVARTTIDGQLVESISFYPQIEQYDWNWVIPDGFTGKCRLEVQVVDAFGNTSVGLSGRFTILSNASAVPDLPGALRLGEPRPNPFNPSTELSLSLPRSGPVSLAVFDLRGHRIRTLLEGTRAAGQLQVHWNGRDQADRPVPAGVYFFLGEFLDETGARARLVRKAVLLP